MTMEGCLFERCRHGSHVWFNLASVYQEAGFQFQVKYASVWTHKHLRAWQEHLSPLGLRHHILRSKPYGEKASGDLERTIPFVVASSHGLVALLSAWSFASRRQCGMRLEANRLAAQTVLAALLGSLGCGWTFGVCLASTVEIGWPRLVRGGPPVMFSVREGKIDFKTLVDLDLQALPENTARVAHSWIAALDLSASRSALPLLEVLRTCWTHSTSDMCLSLLMQCVHRFGERLSMQVARRAEGNDLDNVGFHVTIGGVDLQSDYKLDTCLRKYVDATRQSFKGGMFHSVTPDKSRCGTLGLLVGAMCDDASLAAWMVPQAASGGRARHQD